jgi:hypothetical protein
MAKLKIRVNQSSTIEEIAEAFEDVLNCGQKEVEFNHLIKIVEALGGEYVTGKNSGKGSRERFRHEMLSKNSRYHDGIFGVDRIHGGKDSVKVRMIDLKRFFKPAIEDIIEAKKAEN